MTVTEAAEPAIAEEPPVDAVATVGAVEDFASWYRAEHPRMLAALTVAGRDADIARAATADAFARALAAWPRVGATVSPNAWTYRVAVKQLRRRTRFRRIGADGAPASIADKRELWAALGRLSAHERLALALHGAARLRDDDLAVVMGCSANAATRLLDAAHHRLAAASADLRRNGS